MGYPIQQSSTGQNLLFMLVLSSDHITGATGKSATLTVTLSKNGAAFGSPSGAVTEVGNGWYKIAGNSTDSGTLGPLALHAECTACDPWDDLFSVVAYNPLDAVRLGMTAFPNVVAGGAGAVMVSGTNAGTTTLGALTVSGSTTLSSTVSAPAGITANITGTITTATNVTNAVVLPANPPAGFLVTASYGAGGAPAWYTAPSAAAIATSVWQDTTAGDFTTAGSIGQRLTTGIPNIAPGGTNGLFIAGTNAATTVTGSLTTTFTGNLTGNVGGNVTGTVGSVVTKTDYVLAAGGLDPVVVETGLNARQALSMCSAALAGTVSGAETTSVTIKGCNVVTTRIVATVDASGNRTPTLTIPT